MTSSVAIVGGRVLPMSGEPLNTGTVLIHDGVIAAVGEAVDIPNSAEVIDANGCWVLPGFIDAHTHVGINEESSGPSGNDVNETSRRSRPGCGQSTPSTVRTSAFRMPCRRPGFTLTAAGT